MPDFFEIDFLDVETDKSGDAIPLRYSINGSIQIHVVDGGFQETGERVVQHIRTHYGNPSHIDRVIVTHPDGDHAGGLRFVLEAFRVRELWMLRPWQYVHEILHRFPTYSSVDSLRARLRGIYSNLAALEDIALSKGIPIHEPFQGVAMGHFVVLAPTKQRYLDLIVNSERTPESTGADRQLNSTALGSLLGDALREAGRMFRAIWGEEVFSTQETSAENEMSLVQYAYLCDQRILLTGDAGRAALAEAADYALTAGLLLPGINRFQVPHHASRRNVSTQILDRWLGPRWSSKPAPGQETFDAFISSAKKDQHHPRKAVVRAFIHRGARVYETEGKSICTSRNAPERPGWSAVAKLPYPEDQEEA